MGGSGCSVLVNYQALRLKYRSISRARSQDLEKGGLF